jgi:RNA polymerase sigma factor (sigma-70 family)
MRNTTHELFEGEHAALHAIHRSFHEGRLYNTHKLDIYIKHCSKAIRGYIVKQVSDFTKVDVVEEILVDFELSLSKEIKNEEKRRLLVEMDPNQRVFWFYSVARYRCLRHFSKNNKQPPAIQIDENMHAPEYQNSGSITPEEVVEQCLSTQNEALLHFLSDLSQQQQVVFILINGANWAAKEVAEYMGLSVNTIYSYNNKARSKLGLNQKRSSSSPTKKQ